MTRQQKTPQQRAQEQLEIEERRVERLAKQLMAARGQVARLQDEVDVAKRRRDYLKQHPDLGQQGPSTTPSSTTTSTGATS